jgi:hypothetical protein
MASNRVGKPSTRFSGAASNGSATSTARSKAPPREFPAAQDPGKSRGHCQEGAEARRGALHVSLQRAPVESRSFTGTEEWALEGNYWRNGNAAILPLRGHLLAGTPSADDFEGEWPTATCWLTP